MKAGRTSSSSLFQAMCLCSRSLVIDLRAPRFCSGVEGVHEVEWRAEKPRGDDLGTGKKFKLHSDGTFAAQRIDRGVRNGHGCREGLRGECACLSIPLLRCSASLGGSRWVATGFMPRLFSCFKKPGHGVVAEKEGANPVCGCHRERGLFFRVLRGMHACMPFFCAKPVPSL